MTVIKVNHLIIADTQFLVVEALKSLIGKDERYLLAGVADTQNDLFPLLDNMSSGLLITDFANPEFIGIDDLKQIRQKYPQLAILILTNTISKAEFAGLTKLGIRNIIYKTSGKDEILSAIESTLKCKKFYSDEILDLFLDVNENKYYKGDPKQLTASELEL